VGRVVDRPVSIRAEDGIVIAVAWYGVRAVGGMPQLLARLRKCAMRRGPCERHHKMLRIFTRADGRSALDAAGDYVVVHLAVQWAFWYPGGARRRRLYRAADFQRADERHGMLSVLGSTWRIMRCAPWPWILTALVAVVLYPGLAQPERDT